MRCAFHPAAILLLHFMKSTKTAGFQFEDLYIKVLNLLNILDVFSLETLVDCV